MARRRDLRRRLVAALAAEAPVEELLAPQVVGRVLAVADEESLVPTIAELVRREAPASFPEGWRAQADEWRELRAALDDERAEVAGPLRDAGIPHAFLKGYVLEQDFPRGLPRQFDDLDLAVPGPDELWRVVEVLRGLGYELLAMSVGEIPPHGLSGAATLGLGKKQLEVMFGGFGLHWFSVLPFDESTWAELRHVDGLPTFGPLWSALLFVAEVSDRARLRVRDGIDARTATRGLTDADWRTLRRIARAASLAGELLLTERALGRSEPSVAERLYLGARQAANTLVRAACHTFPYVRRRSGSRVAAKAVAAVLARDVLTYALEAGREGVLVERATRLLNRLDSARSVRDGGYLVLVPIDEERSEPFELAVVGGRVIVRTPVGLFLGVAMPLVTQEDLDEASTLAEAG